MDDNFKILIREGSSRIMLNDRIYFPTLSTGYTSARESVFVYNFGFGLFISKDTSRNAEPDLSLGNPDYIIAINSSLSNVKFKPHVDIAAELFRKRHLDFGVERFYRAFLPIWNESKKDLKKLEKK